ncbi:MAG TPA: hypothetical protein VM925_14145, partial [Labilithrix sp.]|nr:hypothetical protein [Labilithrix sp.]
MRRTDLVIAALVPACLAGWMLLRVPATTATPASVAETQSPSPVLPAPASPASSDDSHDDERSYVFRIPSGEPTSLSCEEARTIVEQVRAGLAYTPESVKAPAFAASAADWLDPHGLLSLAKDAPSADALQKVAPDLLADIEGRRQRSCASATTPGSVLEK